MQYSKDKTLGEEQYSSHVALVESFYCSFVMNSEKYVVFRKVNDLVFFITGSGFYSELICVFELFVLSFSVYGVGSGD